MSLINKIFPFKLYLTILQLEEYKIQRFVRWYLKNIFVRNLPNKKPIVFTQKIKILLTLSAFWFLTITLIILFFTKNTVLVLIIPIILLTQPLLLIILSLSTFKPYEIWNKKRIIKKTTDKILSNKDLTVVGITGSYAKTSVKEILYQLLQGKYNVLRTPESYNTIFGIAKVVDLELDSDQNLFICELGAYNKGEIKELCKMVRPQYGILTGITKQHLERFGSLKNIINAKFELVDYINNPSKMVFNVQDKNIRRELKRRNIKTKTKVNAKNIKFDKNGTSYCLIIGRKKYRIRNKLFGYQNVQNTLIAINSAILLGIRPKDLIESIKNLKPFSNRFVIKKVGNTAIIDNTYNSNPKGFLEMLKTAKSVTGKKALITPGIVELGKEEEKAHLKLGRYTNAIFTKVILVGKNKRTTSLAKGIKNKNAIFIKDNREEYNAVVNRLVSENYDWVFLENDITQNY